MTLIADRSLGGYAIFSLPEEAVGYCKASPGTNLRLSFNNP